MKFACESCQTKYTIADEKVRGKVLKIRCKKCGSVITVKEEVAAAPEPMAPPVEERTRVADLNLLNQLRQAEAMTEAPQPTVLAPAPELAQLAARAAAPEQPQHEWYAMVNGEQVGPLLHDDFVAKTKSGEVNDRTHVWRDGLGDWQRAGDVGELADLFAPPPPVAPPPPMVAPQPARAGRTSSAANAVAAAAPAPLDNDSLFGDVPEPTGTGARGLSGEADFSGQAAQPQAPRPSSVAGAIRPGANGANGRASPSSLDHLMGDMPSHEPDHEPSGASPVSVGADPFASVPDAPSVQPPKIGEETRFFMKKAGVTNRNPWWKYAIFAVLVIVVPVGIIFALGTFGVGGTVIVIDANGQQQQVAALSFKGLANNGIGKMLRGETNAPITPPAPPKKAPAPKPDATTAQNPKPTVDPNAKDPNAGLSDEEKKKLQANGGLLDDVGHSGGPKERKAEQGKAPDTNGGEALSQDAVARVVADSSKGFNKCVEDHLKRDPDWRGGKVNLTLKIGPSGTVLDCNIDKASVSNSDVGECLKTQAKRMHFPRFSGEDPQEVQFPLLLTNGG